MNDFLWGNSALHSMTIKHAESRKDIPEHTYG